MLNGVVNDIGYNSTRGNWIIIADNNRNSIDYGKATLYMHLASQPSFNVGDEVYKFQQIGMERFNWFINWNPSSRRNATNK